MYTIGDIQLDCFLGIGITHTLTIDTFWIVNKQHLLEKILNCNAGFLYFHAGICVLQIKLKPKPGWFIMGLFIIPSSVLPHAGFIEQIPI